MPLEDAVEAIKIATRQLSRRQVKWFRRWSQIHCLDAAALASVEAQADAILAAMAQPSAPPLPTGLAEC